MPFSTSLILQSSATVTINSLALAKKARGERVYNLSAGEPVMSPPAAVVAAAELAIRNGQTLYPPVSGIAELRTVAARWMESTFSASYTPEETIVTCGGKFAIYTLCQAFLTPGDGAVIIAPYWVSYPSIIRLFGAIPQIVPTTQEQDWKATAEAIERVITPRTKLLFINNAANPTGVFYSRVELEALLAVAARHNLLVISDEVYGGLMYDQHHFISAGSFPEYRDRVVVVQSCSKHFAMTGWRVGFAFGPQEIIQILTMIQSQSTTGTSSISQGAAVGALSAAVEVMGAVRGAMQTRRDIFMAEFKTLFGRSLTIPAALYALVPISQMGSSETNSVHFCERLLNEANVTTVPGSPFGAEGYVRFSFGASEEDIVGGLRALKKWLG